MLVEVIKAFTLIFFAEMGDKTQILAMAFATRYPVRKVLLGIAVGSFLNHGLAVILGSYISSVIPLESIQLLSGVAFVGFAFWTLRVEEEGKENDSKIKYGPIITVALAFFIGELGDKTQLAAITLATEASYPHFMLLGTVSGMVVTGSLGIIVGKRIGDNIPELAIKMVSSTVFLMFGLQKIYANTPKEYLSTINVTSFLIATLAVMALLINRLNHQENSRFKHQAMLLQKHFKDMETRLEELCLGENVCQKCDGASCSVGYAKKLVRLPLESNHKWENLLKESMITKKFDIEGLLTCLIETIQVIEEVTEKKLIYKANLLRRHLEETILGESIPEYSDIDSYIELMWKIDNQIAAKIKETL